MIVRLEGTVSDNSLADDDIKVNVSYDDYGQGLTMAKEEEIINDLATKLARKLVAARRA